MTQVPFPYPRKSVTPSDIVRGNLDATFLDVDFDRKNTREAIIFRSQYFGLERLLLESFNYVSPSVKNKNTFSINFATIIKNAASLYELVSKWLYAQFYTCSKEEVKGLNVYNYLSLELDLECASKKVTSFQYFDTFDLQEVYCPFYSLRGWDKSSLIQSSQVPSWWTANNRLKHSNSGLDTHGTLSNTLAAIAANFLVLHTIYGPGMVYGPNIKQNGAIHELHTASILILDT